MKETKLFFQRLLMVVITMLAYFDVNAVSHHLRINIHGMSYDSLYIYGDDINKVRFLIRGEKENATWLFNVPDSVYTGAVQGYSITHRLCAPGSDHAYKISVKSVIDKDSITVGLMFDDKYPDIDLIYLYNKEVNTSFVVNGSLIRGTLSDDNYFISFNKGSDSYLYNKYMAVCGLYSDDDLTYVVKLKCLKSIIKENPSSEFLMSRVCLSCPYAKSKDDLLCLFNYFSTNVKNSYWGKQVRRYVGMKYFENMILFECKTGCQEQIVCNTDKYNLIIFSASWCGPCHKAIPALKKIHFDLNDKLNMTYISLDEPDTVEEWERLMVKENILWRSLLSGPKVKIVREKYLVYGIPYMILVYPGRDMLMEVIEGNWDSYLYQVIK